MQVPPDKALLLPGVQRDRIAFGILGEPQQKGITRGKETGRPDFLPSTSSVTR